MRGIPVFPPSDVFKYNETNQVALDFFPRSPGRSQPVYYYEFWLVVSTNCHTTGFSRALNDKTLTRELCISHCAMPMTQVGQKALQCEFTQLAIAVVVDKVICYE